MTGAGADRRGRWAKVLRMLPGVDAGTPATIRVSHVVIAALVLPLLLLLGTWIGFFNVGADTGHWKITAAFLEFAKRSAVRTYAYRVDVPGVLDTRPLQLAAAHFARGCAVCHGAPGEPRTPPVLRMLPQPPDLSGKVDEWTDAQLYRLVMHGIRFTGMPAWQSQAREDEVWAMVAFLRRLPALTVEDYRDLAYAGDSPDGPAEFPARQLAYCERCHAEDGFGRTELTPVLAGQTEEYLAASLKAYTQGDRPSGFMTLGASGTTDAEMAAFARHFAQLQPPPPAQPPEAAVETGRRIAENGIAAKEVPACQSCHADRNKAIFPRLEAQHAAYLSNQLRLFRSGVRGGTEYGHIMQLAARNLSEADISAVAAYYSSRPRQHIPDAPEGN